jgi:hypothetical protein
MKKLKPNDYIRVIGMPYEWHKLIKEGYKKLHAAYNREYAAVWVKVENHHQIDGKTAKLLSIYIYDQQDWIYRCDRVSVRANEREITLKIRIKHEQKVPPTNNFSK